MSAAAVSVAAPGHVSAPPAASPARRPLATPPPASPYSRTRKVLGDPAPLACTVAKTALEVVLGEPGVEKLTRWVTPEVRAALAQQHSLARRAGVKLLQSVRIARVRVYRVTAKAAEVSVVADDGVRVRAIAMRLEDVHGRWVTTVLEVG